MFTEIKQLQIKPKLCDYKDGIDCRNLRLGDEYHSIKEMGRGYLYSCDGKNPSAPGSIQERITWINFPNLRRHGTSSRNSGYLREIFAQE